MKCRGIMVIRYKPRARWLPIHSVDGWHEGCSIWNIANVYCPRSNSLDRSVSWRSHVPLIKNRYGKGRVRIMRIHRDGDKHEVSHLNIKAMLEGDFARAYTDGDNSTSTSTDTIKNIVNVVARENTAL